MTALVTALSALLGAWVGARVALDQFKKERAFDTQLEWYRDAVRLLFNARRELSALIYESEIGQDPTAEALDRMVAAPAKAAEQADTGHLFASVAAIEALRGAAAAFDRRRDPRQMTTEENLAALRLIVSAYTDSAEKVAAEGRRHLRLESLPAPAKIRLSH